MAARCHCFAVTSASRLVSLVVARKEPPATVGRGDGRFAVSCRVLLLGVGLLTLAHVG